MSSAKVPSKATILDVIILALAHSDLREVGLDALRGVLKSDPRMAVLDGSLRLQPVWEVLESQEGFDAEAAKPPFFRVKALESRLGVKVVLPAALEATPAADADRYAERCPVKREDVDAIIAAQPATTSAMMSSPMVPVGGFLGRGRARLLLMLSIALIVASVVVTALLLTRT